MKKWPREIDSDTPKEKVGRREFFIKLGTLVFIFAMVAAGIFTFEWTSLAETLVMIVVSIAIFLFAELVLLKPIDDYNTKCFIINLNLIMKEGC